MQCQQCDNINPEEAKFCGKCGNKFEPPQNAPPSETPIIEPNPVVAETAASGLCPTCSTQNAADAEFCSACGGEIVPTEIQPLTIAAPTNLTAVDPTSIDPWEEVSLRYLEVQPVTLRTNAACKTDIGLVKDEQEDQAGIFERLYRKHNVRVTIAVVADGMGGHDGGENCAKIGISETELYIAERLPFAEREAVLTRINFLRLVHKTVKEAIPDAAHAANARVRAFAVTQDINEICGATLVVAVVITDLVTGYVKVYGFNQGDARCCLAIGNELIQLSKDHVFETGDGDRPYWFLGAKAYVGKADFQWEVWMSEANFESFKVLLYSDGLHNMLGPEQIRDIANASPDAQSCCDGLMREALTVETPVGKNATTGDDNIGIAVVQVQRGQEDNSDDQ